MNHIWNRLSLNKAQRILDSLKENKNYMKLIRKDKLLFKAAYEDEEFFEVIIEHSNTINKSESLIFNQKRSLNIKF